MRSCAALLLLSLAIVSSVHAQDTVQVKAGWNIIGSVKAGAVPDVLSTIPDSIIRSSFFGYAPGVGYKSTDTLGKGLGYWVKVSADGIIVFSTETSIAGVCGAKRVTYAGNIYHTVRIGDQCWLEENLDVGTMVTGVTGQTDNAAVEKYCYGDSPLNCALYGGLYQWDEAMQYTASGGTQGLCPPGWHIPTYADFQTLSSAVGGDGNVLKAVGQGTGDGAGTNTSGFSALLAGYRYFSGGGFLNLGNFANFWSSTEYDATFAGYLALYLDNGTIYLYLTANKAYGYSVRCLED